jgi:hypothetical protein
MSATMTIQKSVDHLLSVAMIALLCWIVGIALDRSSVQTSARTTYPRLPESPKIGSPLAAEGSDWRGGRRAVVLITASDCLQSARSLGFYRALSQRMRKVHDWAFIIVGDETDRNLFRWLDVERVGAERVILVNMPALGLC